MIFVRFHHIMRATLCTDNCRSHQSEAPSTARYARRGVERGHGLLRTEVTELWGAVPYAVLPHCVDTVPLWAVHDRVHTRGLQLAHTCLEDLIKVDSDGTGDSRDDIACRRQWGAEIHPVRVSVSACGGTESHRSLMDGHVNVQNILRYHATYHADYSSIPASGSTGWGHTQLRWYYPRWL
jgi:hypothetical protein